jgi:hypothetical protein
MHKVRLLNDKNGGKKIMKKYSCPTMEIVCFAGGSVMISGSGDIHGKGEVHEASQSQNRAPQRAF